MDSIDEKGSSPFAFITSNAIFKRASEAYDAFQQRRDALGLPNPGTFSTIMKEVDRDVFTNSLSFTGVRGEIAKTFSASPMFTISHMFSSGSQAINPYAFSAYYGTSRAFLQGQMDNELGFYGRLHWRTSSSWVTKSTVQIQPNMGSQFELDNEWTGKDFVASVKLMNPSVLEGGFTGIVSGDYLQSVTPKLALGLNAHWQRPTLRDGPESLVSYCARYNAKTWIGAAQFMPGGVFKASYWRKLADKVEAAADLTLQVPPSAGPMGQGGRPEGVATIGAKYDFLVSSFRAQVDSQGRVSSLLDKRVTPGVSLQFFGEIDHYKNQSKLGMAVSIESSDEEVIQSQQAGGTPTPPM